MTVKKVQTALCVDCEGNICTKCPHNLNSKIIEEITVTDIIEQRHIDWLEEDFEDKIREVLY